jgi:DNA-binding MarR family transcriptional regulator
MQMPGYRFILPTREYRELTVLKEVARNPRATQRSMAAAAGVSAAMVNAYVDDLVTRGLLGVSGDTNRTYRYVLTGAGSARCEALLQELLDEAEDLCARLREGQRLWSGATRVSA